MISEQKKYDLAFIGIGASNSLIFKSLFEKGILQNLKIAVIEPVSKTKNDKTFCFWATKNEIEDLRLSTLFDQSWGKISGKNQIAVEIDPLSYYHVSSINLYNHVRKLISLCNVDFFSEKVTDIHYQNTNFNIHTEETIIYSAKVFDSRPPEWEKAKSHQTFLWQSFLGWKIKTTKPVFDKEVFTMMDFEVDQADATQFVYILPYSDNYALVELTRFGKKSINHDYARKEIEKYCKEKKWDFTMLEEEHGMIPMCSMDMKPGSVHINHIQTGSAAGKIKPSTGYAFKEMAADAVKIAENFSMNKSFSKDGVHHFRAGKFAFYDRLLLKILETNPEKGKPIFTGLLSKVEPRLVLKFLEQKTGFREDIAVLMSMPKGIFIKKALMDCLSRFRNIWLSFLPLLSTLLFLFLQYIGLESIGFISLAVGLIVLGIPHGAMDHILDQKSTDNRVVFVIKYILKGSAIFILWKISAIVALLLFIIYTAFHFGQADFIQWKLSSGLGAFTWGLGVLLFLLFSHAEQTAFVLSQLLNNRLIVDYFTMHSFSGCVLSLFLMLITLLINKKPWIIISIITMGLLSRIPLLDAFGIYFICQHSLNGWLHIKSRFNKTDTELWQYAFPFTVGAIILFIIFFTSFSLNWKSQLGSFFVFISCISFPHVLSMDLFYKDGQSKKERNFIDTHCT